MRSRVGCSAQPQQSVSPEGGKIRRRFESALSEAALPKRRRIEPEPVLLKQSEAQISGSEALIDFPETECNSFHEQVNKINSRLKNLINVFRAGMVADFLPAWEAITSDKEILSAISGLEIDHEGLVLGSLPKKCNFSKSDSALIDAEIAKLLKKGVISLCGKEENDFFSPIFLREKQDKSHRMILNLNKHTVKKVSPLQFFISIKVCCSYIMFNHKIR